MGTWGLTAFEDDTAMEFYDTFCQEGITKQDIEESIDLVLSRKYDMELNGLLMEGFTEPLKALVVAEIIAKARGKGINEFPDEEYHNDMELPQLDLKEIKSLITDSLIDNTISVIKKIQTDKNIHYQTLWEESDNFESWMNYTNDLIDRLKN